MATNLSFAQIFLINITYKSHFLQLCHYMSILDNQHLDILITFKRIHLNIISETIRSVDFIINFKLFY
jgi:hypothetical protein